MKNADQMLFQMLGGLPTTETEKVAHDLDQLSVEELEVLASSDGQSFVEEAAEEIEAIEKVSMVDGWARELAKTHVEELEKVGFDKEAFLARAAGKLFGAGSRAASTAAQAVKNAPATGRTLLQKAKTAPGKAGEFLKKDWEATKSHFQAGAKGQAAPQVGMGGKSTVPKPAPSASTAPSASAAAPAVEGAAEAAKGGAKKGGKKGLSLGQKAAIGTGVGLAGLGGAYALSGGGSPGAEQPAGMIHTAAAEFDAADMAGRIMARSNFEKTALLPTGAIRTGVGKAMGALTTGSGVKHGLIGAGIGAAGGALQDPGQGGSRLKNMAIGAGLGGGLGAAAKPLAQAAGSMNNRVGRYLGGAQKSVAQQTGNIAHYRQAQQMQQARMGAQRVAKNQRVAPAGAAPKPAAPAAAPAAAPTGAGPVPGGGFVD